MAAPRDVCLILTARDRVWRLDSGPEVPPADPGADRVIAAWEGRSAAARSLTLIGGEPTLRADLPRLLQELAGAPSLGIRTDGLALTRRSAVQALAAAGLRRVRLVICAARVQAHDWLARSPGGLRGAVRAAGVVRDAGLELEVEIPLTRSGAPLLAETVALAARLGAARVRIRRPVLRGAMARDYVALSPRLSLCQPELEAAAAAAGRAGVELTLHGLPACACGAAAALRAPGEPLLVPGGWTDFYRPPDSRGACGICTGQPDCGGWPADYVRRFGDAELALYGEVPVRDVLSLPFPAPSGVACPSCGDGPEAPSSARTLRRLLARAGRGEGQLLRAGGAGTLHHPELVALARDARRLRMRLELAGEGSALAGLSDTELRHLRGSEASVSLAFFGPDAARHDAHAGRPGAFGAALAAAERLAGARIPVGAYAILHHHRDLADYARAWAEGLLPGRPRFRLSPDGGDLRALARAAQELEAGAARAAIAAVLPPCLLPRDAAVAPAPAAPERLGGEGCWGGALYSGSDPLGRYRPCAGAAGCEPRRCPGLALGWAGGPAPQ